MVEAVRFVLITVYGKTSFDGVSIAIWGDGYERRKDKITRLTLRAPNLTDCENTKYSAQSSVHQFLFAEFLRNDTRINMNLNLASEKVVWLALFGNQRISPPGSKAYLHGRLTLVATPIFSIRLGSESKLLITASAICY